MLPVLLMLLLLLEVARVSVSCMSLLQLGSISRPSVLAHNQKKVVQA